MGLYNCCPCGEKVTHGLCGWCWDEMKVEAVKEEAVEKETMVDGVGEIMAKEVKVGQAELEERIWQKFGEIDREEKQAMHPAWRKVHVPPVFKQRQRRMLAKVLAWLWLMEEPDDEHKGSSMLRPIEEVRARWGPQTPPLSYYDEMEMKLAHAQDDVGSLLCHIDRLRDALADGAAVEAMEDE